MFQVFDNDKPADCLNHKVDKSWSNSKFETFDEAVAYADNWLGQYAGEVLELNKPIDYSGYGDKLVIKEVL